MLTRTRTWVTSVLRDTGLTVVGMLISRVSVNLELSNDEVREERFGTSERLRGFAVFLRSS
jgi:hypothetical protein